MSTKFSTLQIVKDHIKTFRLDNNEGVDRISMIYNFLTPLILAILFLFFHNFLVPSIITVLITVLSIFIALLLNLLFLMYSILTRRFQSGGRDGLPQNDNGNTVEDNYRTRLLKETYYNVQFSVLSCIYALIAIILYVLLPSELFLDLFLGFAVYYFLFLFIITLFMVLKRTHTLFSREF